MIGLDDAPMGISHVTSQGHSYSRDTGSVTLQGPCERTLMLVNRAICAPPNPW